LFKEGDNTREKEKVSLISQLLVMNPKVEGGNGTPGNDPVNMVKWTMQGVFEKENNASQANIHPGGK